MPHVTADTKVPEPPLVERIALTIDCSDPNTLADFYANGLRRRPSSVG
jgi:hypothetical protein